MNFCVSQLIYSIEDNAIIYDYILRLTRRCAHIIIIIIIFNEHNTDDRQFIELGKAGVYHATT